MRRAILGIFPAFVFAASPAAAQDAPPPLPPPAAPPPDATPLPVVPQAAPPVVQTTPAPAQVVIVQEAPDEQPPPPSQRPASRSHFGFKLAGGPAYRRIYDSYFTGADLQIAVGGEGPDAGFYLNVGVLPATTAFGLRARGYQTGGTGEAIFDRFRIGGGFQFSYLEFIRVTDPGHSMWGLGIGLTGFASFDLIQFEEHAIFISARLTIDYLGGGSDQPAAFPWGPSGLVGFRY